MLRLLFSCLLLCGVPAAIAGFVPVQLQTAPTLTEDFRTTTREPDVYPGSHTPGTLTIFTSYRAAKGARGTYHSGVFNAPAEFAVELLGYPNMEGLSIYLENAAKEKLPLHASSNPSDHWATLTWQLPKDWVGKPVQFVAEDAINYPVDYWISIGPIYSASDESLAGQIKETGRLFLLLLQSALLYLLPGFAVAALVCRWRPMPGTSFVAIALLGSAATAYAAFWVTVEARTLQSVFSFLTVAVAALIAVWLGMRLPKEILRTCGLCFGVTLFAAGLYTFSAASYTYTSEDLPIDAERRLLRGELPIDNRIPEIIGDAFLKRDSFHLHVQELMDRPPLQAGAYLFQMPFWLKDQSHSNYTQMLGCFLQCTWVAAVMVLLLTAGATLNASLATVALIGFSGWAFINSWFVWPKMFSASLVLVALSKLPMLRGKRAWTWLDALVFGSGMALALLAHEAVAFTFLGLALVPQFWRTLPDWRKIGAIGLLVIVLVLPWHVLKRQYVPGGAHLLRMHLLGLKDDDHRPLLEAARDAYFGTPVRTIVGNHVVNFREMLGFWEPYTSLPQFLGGMLSGMFFNLLPALGFAAFGFLMVRFGRYVEPPVPWFWWQIAGGSVLVWWLLMYAPRSTIIHQGSYATMLLVFIALAIKIWSVSPRILFLVAAIQGLFVFVGSVMSKPLLDWSSPVLTNGVWHSVSAVVAGLMLLSALVVLSRCWRED